MLKAHTWLASSVPSPPGSGSKKATRAAVISAMSCAGESDSPKKDAIAYEQPHSPGARAVLIRDEPFRGQVGVHIGQRMCQKFFKAFFQGFKGNAAVYSDLEVGPYLVDIV